MTTMYIVWYQSFKINHSFIFNLKTVVGVQVEYKNTVQQA